MGSHCWSAQRLRDACSLPLAAGQPLPLPPPSSRGSPPAAAAGGADTTQQVCRPSISMCSPSTAPHSAPATVSHASGALTFTRLICCTRTLSLRRQVSALPLMRRLLSIIVALSLCGDRSVRNCEVSRQHGHVASTGRSDTGDGMVRCLHRYAGAAVLVSNEHVAATSHSCWHWRSDTGGEGRLESRIREKPSSKAHSTVQDGILYYYDSAWRQCAVPASPSCPCHLEIGVRGCGILASLQSTAAAAASSGPTYGIGRSDPFEILTAQHVVFKKLLTDLDSPLDNAQLFNIAQQLIHDLCAHTSVEERYLQPLFKTFIPGDEVSAALWLCPRGGGGASASSHRAFICSHPAGSALLRRLHQRRQPRQDGA